ncbi:hypothetical protein PQC11_gp163 [Synechococcus phage S-H9-1]|uniref:Uncharacterized protein n=1 Tax=Synechococcus phage S-H9-1 TaxID=2783674 RepID=A0A873WJE5_9CAUD|nr:hypothetical protein PQC11_gp163 [Synechococcus phage S-H9-1]QPB08165.1 hypothetical protein [Synechococcus phage S-H9-1]
MLSKLVKKYVSLLKNIPERHYWPIFVFLSLYFIVPVSEITVTVAAILYFKFEKRIAPVIQKLTKRVPDFFKYGGSILFFLVMIDDTLFYGLLIALAFWSAKQVKKETGTSPSQDGDAVLELQGNQETHETDCHS